MDIKKTLKNIALANALIFIFAFGGANAGPLAASFCPECFGFKSVGNNIFMDNVSSDKQIETFKNWIQSSKIEVTEYFPTLASNPRFLVCLSTDCDARMGNVGAKAQTYKNNLIYVTSKGFEQKFVTHELSHVAFHEKAANLLSPSGVFPAWFDEGLAVIISKDERYIVPSLEGKKACIRTDIDDLPSNTITWGHEAGKDRMVYSRAACRVEIWLEKNGGKSKFYDSFVKILDEGKFIE